MFIYMWVLGWGMVSMEVGGHLLGAGSLLLLCTLSDSTQVINLSSKCFYSLSILGP